ncbi:MAG: hypothetical protein RL719_336, partial [Actinomycetota bacterium]
MSTPKVVQRNEHRLDIQALRTIAVSLVVLFHLWPSRVSGGFVGVDVFFVISGFLITSHILRDVEKQRFSVARFWARRVRRLLPASFTVLLATAITVLIFAPISLWQQWLREVQASIFYVENWVLAADSVDYLALANTASPTQHFWSLATEEQFYILWPLLISAALFAVGKASTRSRLAMLLTLATLTVASLAYGIYATATDPAVAYFSTPVRAWEFGAGALLAFAPPLAHKLWSPIMVVAGLGAIGFSGLALTPEMAFPGTVALIPVLGTVAVLWAAVSQGPLAPLLALKPIQWVGDKSYSIYLWHWPLIILAPYVLKDDLSLPVRLAIVALTIVLAWFSATLIEKPFGNFGRWPNVRPRTVFASLAIISLVFAGSLSVGVEHSKQVIAQDAAAAAKAANEANRCFGAAARAPGQQPCENSKLKGMFPSLAAAAEDRGIDPKVCGVMVRADSKPKVCHLGVKDSSIRIAAIGESHIGHYVGGLEDLAKKNHWALDIIWKAACPFSNAARHQDAEMMTACASWVGQAQKLLIAGNYDLVITSQKSGVEWVTQGSKTQKQTAVDGLVSVWNPIVAAGIPVMALKDNPRPRIDVMSCLSVKGYEKCGADRMVSFLFDPQVEAVAKSASPLVTLVQFD